MFICVRLIKSFLGRTYSRQINAERFGVNRQRFVAFVIDQPAAAQFAHRNGYVRTAHRRHLRQLVVADGKDDLTGRGFARFSARRGDVQQNAPQSFFRAAIGEKFDAPLAVAQAATESKSKCLNQIAARLQKTHKIVELDFENLASGGGAGVISAQKMFFRSAETKLAERLARFDDA